MTSSSQWPTINASEKDKIMWHEPTHSCNPRKYAFLTHLGNLFIPWSMKSTHAELCMLLLIIKPSNSFENPSLISDTITPCSRLVIHDGKMYFLSFVKIYQPLILLKERLLVLWTSRSFALRESCMKKAACFGLGTPSQGLCWRGKVFSVTPIKAYL